jgi:ubiquinone/menaquinone biosynthesis C-methylase UbiE
MNSLHQGFQQTGQPNDSEAVFRWLDRMDGNPLIQQVKLQMLDVCPVGDGDQILDVGCGLGHEARRLAERVGPHGRVVGIDANTVMIAEARQRVAGPTLPVAFEVGDAQQMDFPDNTFDLCSSGCSSGPVCVTCEWFLMPFACPARPGLPSISNSTRAR